MREHKGFTGAQIALAFLGGAATGTAVAIITAPKSGRETREQLTGYLRRGKEKTARLPDTVRSATSRAREAFESAISDVESQFMQ